MPTRIQNNVGRRKPYPKIKRQITQLLDTSIECEKLKQRINAQEA